MLESERLLIRDWQVNDALALHDICLDPQLRRNGVGFYENIRDSRKVIRLWRKQSEMKAIVRKEDKRVVGLIGLGDMNRYSRYKELEIAIAADCRGQGYAAEALQRMLAYAFDALDIAVVAAWVRSHNTACARLLETCGFYHEGTLRRHARDQSDTLCYSILKEEWKGKYDESTGT